MSIVPEFILQKVIANGFRKFREDQKLLPMLFRNLNVDEVAELQKYIRDQPIDLAVNWPDTQLKLPSIILSLKNETESQAFLNYLMQSSSGIRNTGTPFRKEKLIAPASVVGSGSVSRTGQPTQPVTDPIRVMDATFNSILFPMTDPFSVSDPFELKQGQELLVVIREGAGAGQRRAVASITPIPGPGGQNYVELVITSNWMTLPDVTSIFELQIQSDVPFEVGEPAKLFEDGEFIERLGALYSTSYQALVVGPNQEITIFLYAILKAILVINRNYLEQNGIIDLRIGGTDFVYKPEYLPELAYQRALILEFQHAFDVYMAAETVRSIRLAIEVGDSSDDLVRVVSETELDLST